MEDYPICNNECKEHKFLIDKEPMKIFYHNLLHESTNVYPDHIKDYLSVTTHVMILKGQLEEKKNYLIRFIIDVKKFFEVCNKIKRQEEDDGDSEYLCSMFGYLLRLNKKLKKCKEKYAGCEMGFMISKQGNYEFNHTYYGYYVKGEKIFDEINQDEYLCPHVENLTKNVNKSNNNIIEI